MNHHQNIHGDCAKCEELFDLYPGFDPALRLWFGTVRRAFFDAHISCAGRGRIEQEAAFHRGASNAPWGRSAHNYNAALDLFRLDPNITGHYSLDRRWFMDVFEKCPLGDLFEWYGAPGSHYPEIPHIQVKDWFDRVIPDALKLVEPA